MTVTTLEPITFEQIVEDTELPCDRPACISPGSPARWVLRPRHKCKPAPLYCDPCHDSLLAYAARTGPKYIWCSCGYSERFRDLSEVIASMERL